MDGRLRPRPARPAPERLTVLQHDVAGTIPHLDVVLADEGGPCGNSKSGPSGTCSQAWTLDSFPKGLATLCGNTVDSMTIMERVICWRIPRLWLIERGAASWRDGGKRSLAMTGEEIEALTALSRSRTEPAGRVSRAAMLLGYREKPSFFAVGRRLGVHHQTVQRCVA